MILHFGMKSKVNNLDIPLIQAEKSGGDGVRVGGGGSGGLKSQDGDLTLYNFG